jgi:hypothetical protein
MTKTKNGIIIRASGIRPREAMSIRFNKEGSHSFDFLTLTVRRSREGKTVITFANTGYGNGSLEELEAFAEGMAQARALIAILTNAAEQSEEDGTPGAINVAVDMIMSFYRED